MTVSYTGPDEYPIKAIPDTPRWSENYAAMFFCPASRVAIYCSIGRWLGDPTMWRDLIMVALPDRTVLYSKSFGRGGTPNSAGTGLSRFEVLEPGKKIRLL